MEQLTQHLKDGFMQLLETPFPALKEGHILVRNHYSVISAGTEGKTVSDARKGYIGKARARKAEVKKVIQAARTHGVMKTYQMVMNKLEAPAALGYSCAGEVIAVAPDVRKFKVGDKVACGGASAVHAEVVSVPINLAVKVPNEVPLQHAAFTTIAAIAMQGIRQADLRLGENCVVIGLGLIGQLTMQMLKASGVKAIGIDLAQPAVDLALKTGADYAFNRDEANLEARIEELTDGHGTDAVIITAGTSSLDPVELAGAVARKKGKVIIVGAVPTGFSRKNYFRKELDLRMSSSYGPGRYDANYEEKGQDYPIGYVRWTENRNMSAYLQLLTDGGVDMASLITHDFRFEEAPKAYQMILDRSEPFVGISLRYDLEKEIKPTVHLPSEAAPTATEPTVGFVGAGSFAQNFLLPAVKGKAKLVSVATSRANTARNAADKYGFTHCAADAAEVLSHADLNTVFIATRHDSHADYVIKALEAGKNVFVEKPLCLREEELQPIKAAVENAGTRLMVGFNRRFAPQIVEAQNWLPTDVPKAINYRINAGAVPADHWVHDPVTGGGRLIGEACHFIDLCIALANDRPVSVSAHSLTAAGNRHDTFVVQLRFEKGSIANISYFSNGNKAMSKEYLEVFCAGRSLVIDDFKTMTQYDGGATKSKLKGQDKGHQAEVEAFLNSIREGKAAPISFAECYQSTLTTFKVWESIQNGGASIDV